MTTAAPVQSQIDLAAARAGIGGLVPFTLRLTRARFAAREGESLLYGASILASTVCSVIAFTVAGGTWMFHRRAENPTGLLAVLAQDATFSTILAFYVGLAVFACALVVPSLISLSVAGAQLGARGRERRLAALRLIGLSSGDVTRMALLDALLQNVVGVLVGFVGYLLTLPLWRRMSFQAMPIEPGEMTLPWWLMVVLGAALVLVGVAAAAWGLRQVRISPLGVSRRASRPAVRVWRMVGLMLAVLVAAVVSATVRLGGGAVAVFIFAGVVVLLLLGINLAGPWLLQTLARLTASARVASVRAASRRIVADPRATWNRVATLGVLAFIGGYLAFMPFSYDPDSAGSEAELSFMQRSQTDFVHGAIITLAAGFLLTATSLLITQASATIERAEQSRALRRMGAPDGFALRVMWLETFAPLALSTVLGAVVGAMLAQPMYRQIVAAGMPSETSPGVMAAVLAAGLAVAAAALFATHPLHRRLLGVEERRND